MSDKFLNTLKAQPTALTENGAAAFHSTTSALVDLFGQIGAMRERNDDEVIAMFIRAFEEDALLAIKMMFFARDIRGGLGERKVFRTLLNYIGTMYPNIIRVNLPLIAEYGRWDDYFALFYTPVERDVIALFKQKLVEDIETQFPSLLAKWLKSENASSKETKKLADRTRKALGLSRREYRQLLSDLRNRINIVERLMSEDRWDEIAYAQVPSKAALKYHKAFFNRDYERFHAYMEDVKAGKAKINTKALFPYELVEKLFSMRGYNKDLETITMCENMWNNLPNYVADCENNRTICVVDVSGSMSGRPMAIAISLGIYFAERITGPFKDHFITFAHNPSLVKIRSNTLFDKVNEVKEADWGGNTDIEATFDLILDSAIRNNLNQEDLPDRILIISDMEFDEARGANGYSWGSRHQRKQIVPQEALFETIARKYKQAGYAMPKLTFWNANARNAQFPATIELPGVQFVSGASPSLFTTIIQNNSATAEELMLIALNNERYAQVRLP